jgi:hypothetical protein
VVTGKATVKVDVFSFGVMLAEMIVNHLTTPGSGSGELSPSVQLSPTTGVKQYGLAGRFCMVDDAVAAASDNTSLVALLRDCTAVNVGKRLHSWKALTFLDDKRKRQEHAAVRALHRCCNVSKALAVMTTYRDAPDVQEAGCLTLRNLQVLVRNRGLAAVIVANSGFERIFAAMGTFTSSVTLQHAGCRLLMHLAADNIVVKERIVALSGLDRICYGMDSLFACPELPYAACGAL